MDFKSPRCGGFTALSYQTRFDLARATCFAYILVLKLQGVCLLSLNRRGATPRQEEEHGALRGPVCRPDAN